MAKVENERASTFRSDYWRYASGFLTALALVIIAYSLTVNKWLSGIVLALTLLLLAAILMYVQLTIFLHIGKDEKGPKLKTYSTLYMFAIAIIMVGCSIWAMYHLNINMGMTPEQMQQYMLDQNNKGF